MASWKKTASILLIVMIILVTGCVKKNNIESPATESATNEVEVSVSTQKVSSKSTPSLAPTPTETPTETTDLAPSATQAVSTENPTLVPSVNPTQTVAPTAKPTVKPTIAPKTTAPTVKPTAKPTATVKPTQKPTPTPTAKPTLTPYDDAKAQYWVDFAEEYAASIGLRVKDAEEYANNLINDGIAEFTYGEGWETASWQAIVRESSSWDTPITVYAKRIQSYIPEDLISRLERYKRVGIKGVCIWYEKYDSEYAPTADAYQIYIAYSGLNEN